MLVGLTPKEIASESAKCKFVLYLEHLFQSNTSRKVQILPYIFTKGFGYLRSFRFLCPPNSGSILICMCFCAEGELNLWSGS